VNVLAKLLGQDPRPALRILAIFQLVRDLIAATATDRHEAGFQQSSNRNGKREESTQDERENDSGRCISISVERIEGGRSPTRRARCPRSSFMVTGPFFRPGDFAISGRCHCSRWQIRHNLWL
jgi:hypothetical protein